MVLRIQSGRGWRRGNIVDVRMRDCGFEPAVQEGQDIAYIEIITSKIGNLTASRAARAQVKSHITLTDKITDYLFRAWRSIVPSHLEDDAYIFPHCGPAAFVWERQFSCEEHKIGCTVYE